MERASSSDDVRRYREERLAGTGLTPVFPVWGLDTRELVHTMIETGVKTRIVCVDPRKLPASFAGRDLDERLLAELPPGVDPRGENGEVVERDGFIFADVKLRKL